MSNYVYKYDVNHGHYIIPQDDERLWNILVNRIWEEVVQFEHHMTESLDMRDMFLETFNLIFDDYRIPEGNGEGKIVLKLWKRNYNSVISEKTMMVTIT